MTPKSTLMTPDEPATESHLEKISMPTPISTAVEVSETGTSRPQVFIMLADTILEGVYRNRLQSDQYCTVWCEKGDRWKESLLAFTYDVIVVDFSLFPEAPIDNLLAIKKLSPESEVIVLSDNEDVRIAVGAFHTGINDYFLKPTNPETLAWAIEKIIRKRTFYPTHAVLSADLMVFSAAHHIGMSESDQKMRSLAAKHFANIFHGTGAVWVWPSEPNIPAEPLQGAIEKAAVALEEFERLHPGVMAGSFETGLTAHPEQWARSEFAWVPLKERWMGGVLVYGVVDAPDQGALARAEFLVRNVEISLENFRRYAEVKQLTYIDDLTGLYNSRFLEIAVEAAINGSKKAGDEFSVLFVDIDHFKKVNDGNGHLVGSQLLIELAHLLKKSMRKPDHLFRYGGDEFIAVLYHTGLNAAHEIAERIRAEIEHKKFFILNKELHITLSIGVATFPRHGKEKKTIIQMADDAMYSGKKSGRNAVFIAGEVLAKAPKKAA